MERHAQILIISRDVVGARMAGPGIRYYHLARELGRSFDVVLAAPNESGPDAPETPFRLVQYTRNKWASLAAFARDAQVIIFPSDTAFEFPELGQGSACLVVDGYDPLLIEWLALTQGSPQEQERYWPPRMDELQPQFLYGDFFICAGERQRDWWLGLLEAHGRINPYTIGEDPSLRRLVDTVPYGLPEGVPQHTRQVMKGVWPGIGAQDRVILWGGGLWPWLDPLTAVRAIARVWQHRQDVRLVFPGTRHPNPGVPPAASALADQARRLADELGLLERAVFLGDWVPYADWPNVLLESDVALTLHYDTLETRLAFRSRVLEYIWGGLPIVATRGDETSALIARYGLGVAVDYGNDVEVAQAILELLDAPMGSRQAGFEQARRELTWERAAQPLIAFCRQPRRAPDKVALGGQVGNPAYRQEIARLQGVIAGYERGRVMRLMRWLHGVRARIAHRLSRIARRG
jgi:glycosyltransferase involved in cell wall biosynthesis